MSSSVSFGNVVTVLEHLQESIDISFCVDGNNILIIKDGRPESYDFPSGEVSQKTLHRLQAKYGIRIEFFYRPELLHKGSNLTQ